MAVPLQILAALVAARIAHAQDSSTAPSFSPESEPVGTLGAAQLDVGVGENAWKCDVDSAAHQNNAWKSYNPNAGVGILKASHCQKVCEDDFFCAAFVYFAKGNKNVTAHNPAGVMPGSCWKLSNQPWPDSTPMKGLITCWKPGVTKNGAPPPPPVPTLGADAVITTLAPAETPEPPATPVPPSTPAPPEAPVSPAESVVVDTPAPPTIPKAPTIPPVVTLAPLTSVAPNAPAIPSTPTTPAAPTVFSSTVEAVSSAGTESAGGAFPWMWVLAVGGIVVVGAIIGAVSCGACGGSDRPKKKRAVNILEGGLNPAAIKAGVKGGVESGDISGPCMCCADLCSFCPCCPKPAKKRSAKLKKTRGADLAPEESTARQEEEPLIAGQREPVAQVPAAAFASVPVATYAAPVATYAAPVAQYVQGTSAVVYPAGSSVTVAAQPMVASVAMPQPMYQQYTGSFVQAAPQPGSTVLYR